jgi:hypothetical protein
MFDYSCQIRGKLLVYIGIQREEVYIPPHTMDGGTLNHPPPPHTHTVKPGKEPPKLCNPVQITPLVVLVGGFDTLAG